MNKFIHLNSRGGRLTVFSLLYLSEGIPQGFSTVALAAYLRQQGAGLTEVGAIVAATFAPWAFKWAWAPLVDLIRIRALGPSRAWILLAQGMMVATMAALLGFDLVANIPLLTTLIIIHNVFAATQDVAIDAMAVRVLPPGEVGTANGVMFASAYLGNGIGGGGALYVSGVFGFTASFCFVLGLMTLILMGVTLPLREPPDPDRPPSQPGSTVLSRILDRIRVFFKELQHGFFGSGPGPLVGAVFAILPPGAAALGPALATPLQVDLHMSQERIAAISLTATIVGAFGCLLGGSISDWSGRPRTCLAVFYSLTAVPTYLLATRFESNQGVAGVTTEALAWALVSYYFFMGARQGVFTGLFMRITNPAVAATQFTGYMALQNLAMTYSSLWQGRFADSSGFAATLTLDAALAFVALPALYWVRGRRQ